MDFSHPYLSRQIIAYIGNKRRLLPLIYRAICDCVGGHEEGLSFLDLFSGTGIVSRLAKLMGMKVYANDWEDFSYVLNRGHLEVNKEDLPDMFTSFGGHRNIIEELNSLPDPAFEDQYVSRHYSPAAFDTDAVDYKKERLFYTRENGLAIDKIRNRIEELYPGDYCREKSLLVDLLLHQAATHTNTSGVFKAYHKGFGGHSGDALTRILSPIVLEDPVLIDCQHRPVVFCGDAANLAATSSFSGQSVDIVYVDPPYNQHQYGSNYHMLNTITRWDKLEVNNRLNASGELEEKAAIRKDWTETRSPYCYRSSATGAFSNLIGRLEARFILVSYSTEGIIPFDDLMEICAEKGKIRVHTNTYVKYRGGKQSLQRLNRNVEFVLIIDTRAASTRRDLRKVEESLEFCQLKLFFGKSYSLEKLRKHFVVDAEAETLFVELSGGGLTLATESLFRLLEPKGLERLDHFQTKDLMDKLRKSVCMTREEEISEIISGLKEGRKGSTFLVRLIPGVLRKIAHKKYKTIFHFWLKEVKLLAKDHEDLYGLIRESIIKVAQTAQRRFDG